jgi:hypothetical protein
MTSVNGAAPAADRYSPAVSSVASPHRSFNQQQRGITMAKFLVTYHGGGMPANPDPEMMKQMKAAFGAWLTEAGSAVADPGAPIKTVAQVANGTPIAQVEIGGYSILQTANLDAAKAILAKHPFVARGGTLQISEILAV